MDSSTVEVTLVLGDASPPLPPSPSPSPSSNKKRKFEDCLQSDSGDEATMKCQKGEYSMHDKCMILSAIINIKKDKGRYHHIGLPRNEIIAEARLRYPLLFPTDISVNDVINWNVDEGFLYSTVDDDHINNMTETSAMTERPDGTFVFPVSPVPTPDKNGVKYPEDWSDDMEEACRVVWDDVLEPFFLLYSPDPQRQENEQPVPSPIKLNVYKQIINATLPPSLRISDEEAKDRDTTFKRILKITKELFWILEYDPTL